MASGNKISIIETAASDAVLQRHPFEVFHGDERQAVFFADVVDGADVGMVEGGGRLRLALETAEYLWVAGNFIGKEFQGNKTMEACIFGLVDNAHSAATEFLHNAVV